MHTTFEAHMIPPTEDVPLSDIIQAVESCFPEATIYHVDKTLIKFQLPADTPLPDTSELEILVRIKAAVDLKELKVFRRYMSTYAEKAQAIEDRECALVLQEMELEKREQELEQELEQEEEYLKAGQAALQEEQKALKQRAADLDLKERAAQEKLNDLAKQQRNMIKVIAFQAAKKEALEESQAKAVSDASELQAARAKRLKALERARESVKQREAVQDKKEVALQDREERETQKEKQKQQAATSSWDTLAFPIALLLVSLAIWAFGMSLSVCPLTGAFGQDCPFWKLNRAGLH